MRKRTFLTSVWHVLPNNDIKSHGESLFCMCNPKIEEMPNGSVICLHNSYDGREFVEKSIEKLRGENNANLS